MKTILCGLLLLCSLTAAAEGLPAPQGPLYAWETVEFSIPGPQPANPFDPDQCRLDATVTTPAGATIALPGFWYQAYTSNLENGAETLDPQGEPGWRIRFLPREPGRYAIRAVLREQDTEKAAWESSCDVAPARNRLRGLVRVEPTRKRYFMLDDGTPFPLIGQNACWHSNAGTTDYEAWFREFEQAGMNYSRIWMFPFAFGIEVLGNERANYNQEKAWRLDRTLDIAARHGIRIMLCFDYHGIFETKPDYWNANNFWPQHTYNAANGGPCATQNDFFTNPEAANLYRKRLRYIVARYAAHPAIMAWEFFNEINLAYKVLNPPDVVAWHDTMAKWLKANDPYNHLVTTSFSGDPMAPEMWGLDSLDYIQTHTYLNGLDTKLSPASNIAEMARKYLEKFNKPMFVGEYGVTWKGFGEDLDPQFRGLKQGVWGGIMCGTAGTAMPWWWETIYAKRLYGIWAALSAFLKDTGFGSPAWQPLPVADSEQLNAYAMTDGQTTLLWLVDKRYAYPTHATQPAEPLDGATFDLPLADGPYEIVWWDTTAGKMLSTETAKTADGILRLHVPQVNTDIAAKVVRR